MFIFFLTNFKLIYCNYYRLAKMCNYHTIQNKWTANWIYRNSQKSHHSITNNNNINSKIIPKSADGHQHFHQKFKQQQYRHNHDHNKTTGKYILTFQNSWKWKFGYGWTILSILDWWLLAAAGLFTWRGIFFKVTPIIGLCLLGVVQWTQFRYENKNDSKINNIDDVVEKKQFRRIASNWQVVKIKIIRVLFMCVFMFGIIWITSH